MRCESDLIIWDLIFVEATAPGLQSERTFYLHRLVCKVEQVAKLLANWDRPHSRVGIVNSKSPLEHSFDSLSQQMQINKTLQK